VKTSKIPVELFCLRCLTHLEWTGYDSGDYLVYKCSKCGYMLGVKVGEVWRAYG